MKYMKFLMFAAKFIEWWEGISQAENLMDVGEEKIDEEGGYLFK